MTAPARPQLTDLEATVLRLVADGWTYAEIATRLTYTTSGITSIASRMFPKLGARSAAHAVHLAYQAGLLRRERHGDHAGYEAHLRRGEDPKACPHGCWAGERAYRAAQRARQRPSAPASAPISPRTSPTSPTPSNAPESRTQRPAA